MGSFLVRIYDPAYPPDVVPFGALEYVSMGVSEASHLGDLVEVSFVWDAVIGATSYVLQVRPSGSVTYDTFNANVGNVLTWPLALAAGTYYSRVVPQGAGSATAEQTVVVA